MVDISPSALGRAGEHRVVSELLLRGFHPLLATVDDGIDIILGNGPTIQVKTSRSPRYQGDKPIYPFGFQSTRWEGGRSVKRGRMLADFAICWCVPPDRFYVIPRSVIGARQSVSIPTSGARKSMFDPYLDAWGALR